MTSDTKIEEWWWDRYDSKINDIEIDWSDRGWTAAHMKRFNGKLEIAIVRWRGQSPYLIALIRNGKVIAGEEGLTGDDLDEHIRLMCELGIGRLLPESVRHRIRIRLEDVCKIECDHHWRIAEHYELTPDTGYYGDICEKCGTLETHTEAWIPEKNIRLLKGIVQTNTIF